MAQPQVTYRQTQLKPGSFLDRKRENVWENTLLYQLDLLKTTGRYDAFRLKWHPAYADPPDHWPVPNHLFWDSDIGKWIEAATYFLHDHKNETIENAIEELTDMILSAQQPDGYLNIHFTVVAPQERFANFRDLHELYNLGHLIEGAVAQAQILGKTRLVECLAKYVALLCDFIGPEPDKRHTYPGHPEIEIALIRLYQVTGDQKHLKLAEYFVDERGSPDGQYGKHYYTWEAERRGEQPYERPGYYPKPKSYWYNQAHAPILQQKTVEGHSVRAMYLLTAAAALDLYRDREDYRTALELLWDNMVEKKMYVNGGIGAIEQWEGFGIDYFLPQATDEGGCYSETCAAIGVMMMAERMLQFDLNAKYSDIMELCLYNAVLCCSSTDGKRFTYVNQLASSDGQPAEFKSWFTCACCPPSLSRTLGFVAGYLRTSVHDDAANTAEIRVHIPAAGVTNIKVAGQEVTLEVNSDWPHDGKIDFSLSSGAVKTSLAIRIPEWASDKWTLSVPSTASNVTKGYLHLSADFCAKHPSFTLDIPITTRFVTPHPYTNQNTAALARGSLIYCLEDVDNAWVTDHFKTLRLDVNSSLPKVQETAVTDQATGEQLITLSIADHFSFIVPGKAFDAAPAAAIGTGRSIANGTSQSSRRLGPSYTLADRPIGITSEEHAKEVKSPNGKDVRGLNFIPFYFRGNRNGKGQMRVGICIGRA